MLVFRRFFGWLWGIPDLEMEKSAAPWQSCGFVNPLRKGLDVSLGPGQAQRSCRLLFSNRGSMALKSLPLPSSSSTKTA